MKRLYKSRKNKVIDGVCGGIAEYFDVDPVLVRILFVLFFFVGGSAIIAYIVGMIIIPVRPAGEETVDNKPVAADQARTEPEQASVTPAKTGSVSGGSLVVGIVLILIGALFLMKNFNFPFFHWDFWWWFERNFFRFLIPGILVVVGLVLIFKSKEQKSD